jgi:hypothetical protein
METPIRSTINHLQLCREARRGGYPVAYTTDAAWLVNQAINRRAQWPDDPGCFRGSCMPVNGIYPKKAIGEQYNHLQNLARKINTSRLIVREMELGEWGKLLLSRMPDRFYYLADF